MQNKPVDIACVQISHCDGIHPIVTAAVTNTNYIRWKLTLPPCRTMHDIRQASNGRDERTNVEESVDQIHPGVGPTIQPSPILEQARVELKQNVSEHEQGYKMIILLPKWSCRYQIHYRTSKIEWIHL